MGIKRTLATTAISLASLVGLANADLIFPSSGVWSQPRIYQDSSEVDYNSLVPGTYTFRTRVDENAGIESSANFLGEITGTENYQNDWGNITLSADAESYRQWTQEIATPGDYQISFTLEPETGLSERISREFNVIPEPATLSVLSIGGLALLRRKRI